MHTAKDTVIADLPPSVQDRLPPLGLELHQQDRFRHAQELWPLG